LVRIYDRKEEFSFLISINLVLATLVDYEINIVSADNYDIIMIKVYLVVSNQLT